MLYSRVSEEEESSDEIDQIQNSVRTSSQKANAPESQLLRYCKDKEIALMIYNSKHKPEQAEIGKHLINEEDSEDFENLPEFE